MRTLLLFSDRFTLWRHVYCTTESRVTGKSTFSTQSPVDVFSFSIWLSLLQIWVYFNFLFSRSWPDGTWCKGALASPHQLLTCVCSFVCLTVFYLFGANRGWGIGFAHLKRNVGLARHSHSIAGCRLCTGDFSPSSFCCSGSFFPTDIQLSNIFMEISVLTDV